MTERQRLLVARPVAVAMHGKCQVIELVGVDFSTLRPHGTLARGTGSIPFSTGGSGRDDGDPRAAIRPKMDYSLVCSGFTNSRKSGSPQRDNTA